MQRRKFPVVIMFSSYSTIYNLCSWNRFIK